MSLGVQPFLPTLHLLTRAARENAAAALFDLMAARGTIVRMAVQGHTSLRLRPPLPIDLRATTAALKLVSHLDGQGLATFWHAYVIERDGRRDEGFELEISWPLPANSAAFVLSKAETDALAAELSGPSTTPQ